MLSATVFFKTSDPWMNGFLKLITNFFGRYSDFLGIVDPVWIIFALVVQPSRLYFSIKFICFSILLGSLMSSESCLAKYSPLDLLIRKFKFFVKPNCFYF